MPCNNMKILKQKISRKARVTFAAYFYEKNFTITILRVLQPIVGYLDECAKDKILALRIQ
jgi:hypothetical protein